MLSALVGGDGARARGGGASVKTGDAGGGVSSKPGAGDAGGDCAGARTGVVGNGAAGAGGAPATASGDGAATAGGDGAPTVGGAGETAATSGLRFLFRLAPRGFPRLTGAGAPKSALPKMARGATSVKDPAVSSLQH